MLCLLYALVVSHCFIRFSTWDCWSLIWDIKNWIKEKKSLWFFSFFLIWKKIIVLFKIVWFLFLFSFQDCSDWKWTTLKFSSLVSLLYCFALPFHWRQFLSRLPSFDNQHTSKYSMYPRWKMNKKNPLFYIAKPMEIPNLRKITIMNTVLINQFIVGLANLFISACEIFFRKYFTLADSLRVVWACQFLPKE